MKNLICFVILLFLILVNNNIKAQNSDFLGSWVLNEAVKLDVENQKFILKGIDFISEVESPRYEGWIEEVVSYEELIDDKIRSGLTTFIYKINKKKSLLTLKVIESQMGLPLGSIIAFKFRFEENNRLILTIKNQEIILNSY